MVTAGVYLLMRTSPLIEYSSTVLILCLWIGSITTVFSSLIGLFQQDIKKVIAYSTMSLLARVYNYLLIIYRHQTICVEVICKNIINSQITKAHGYIYNHISINLFNSSLAFMWQYFYIMLYIIMSVRWKINIISKLVGISEAIRLMLIYLNYMFKFANLFILKISTKYPYSTHNHNLKNTIDNPFNEWLSGLIDGNGSFILTKEGYAYFKITMDIRDKKALYDIKQKFGGSIKAVANANALKYKLKHKKGLISLINNINGKIRNPVRLLQMNKLCVKYGIVLKYSNCLTFNNGWLSGFIDSDGSIYYNEKLGQVYISITQKNKYILEPLIKLYGGTIDILNPKVEAFKYIIYRKSELFYLIDQYFINYPLKTDKMKRLNLIKQFYSVRIHTDSRDIDKFNEWIAFKDKWDKYKD